MLLARIDGSVVSSHGHPTLKGWRLAICQPVDEKGNDDGDLVLAIDPHHAGLHQRVMVTTDGQSTATRVHDDHSPLRNMIIAIIDN